MKQPWIDNAKTDFWAILAPPFLVLFIVFVFQEKLMEIQEEYSFFTWLFLIVFVDVAHVYSTLFKTYFVKEEFKRRKLLYLGIPAISLVLGILLFQFGSLTFWSVLALVAVFHFIRQQYGFMRIYSRFEPKGFGKKLDGLIIYSATIYPMIFWFFTPRKFTWFVENEFNWMQNLPNLLPVFTGIYLLIIAVYVIKTCYEIIKFKTFNIPKNAVIIGTFLSWYFGIVYFNSDLIFTFLNVISHGIPYISLIYIREIIQKDRNYLKNLSVYKSSFGILLFVLILFSIAFFEEFLWEILVWKENISVSNISLSENWQMLLVPLLTVPQLTHYLLDGFIWRTPKK